MDPTAALAIILDDPTNTRARYDLRAWLKGGGFAPRVGLHPATDTWMRGDRYGYVTAVGRVYLTVRLDSGRVVRVAPENLVSTR